MAICVPGMPCFENTPLESCSSCSSCETVFPYSCTPECTPISSDCVYYNGPNLVNSGIESEDDLTTVIQKLDELVTSVGVPSTRILTIHGISYDLSADRTWADFTFAADIPVVLSGSKSLGKYVNGETIPATGLTVEELFNLIALEYIPPVFTSFSISGQSTTIEVGTTLTTPATFNWAITVNSGVVATIDIKDATLATTLLASTPNDGTQAGVALGVIQLNSDGTTHSYKGTLHDTGTSPSDIDSGLFTITSRFYRWWDAVAATPANSAAVRALPNSGFQTSGNSFTLNTGTTLIKFSVNLPPSVTIVSVIDTGNLNLDITSQYVLIGTVSVLDAGGTARTYNQYEMNIGVPYPTSTTHVITTS